MIFIIIYRITEKDILLSLAITFGTCSYHFLMRLIVGCGINAVYHNRMDYHKKWFQPKTWESGVYKKLKVKNWKEKMPTYDVDTFSFELHSMEEIVMAMCQSEVVHEAIVVLSFIPVSFSIRFAIRGVPREREAISSAPSLSISIPKIPADRVTISASSSGV